MDASSYATWLKDEVFKPTACVVATQGAQERLQRTNRMTFGELLTPFGMLHRGSVSVEAYALNRKVFLDKFGVHFVDVGFDTEKMPTALAEQIAQQMLDRIEEPVASLADLGRPSRWFIQWRALFFTSLRWDSHESLHQPLAALLLVLSSEPNPLELFAQLSHRANLPPLCRAGVLDDDPPKVYILVHDSRDPRACDEELLATTLSQMQQRYPPYSCYVMRINRRGIEEESLQNIFKPYACSREGVMEEEQTIAMGIGQVYFP